MINFVYMTVGLDDIKNSILQYIELILLLVIYCSTTLKSGIEKSLIPNINRVLISV